MRACSNRWLLIHAGQPDRAILRPGGPRRAVCLQYVRDRTNRRDDGHPAVSARSPVDGAQSVHSLGRLSCDCHRPAARRPARVSRTVAVRAAGSRSIDSLAFTLPPHNAIDSRRSDLNPAFPDIDPHKIAHLYLINRARSRCTRRDCDTFPGKKG